MKIINVLGSNKRGGLEQAFVNITNSLVRLGHQVEVWIPADAPYADALSSHATTCPINIRGFYDFSAVFKTWIRLKSASPDLIITHNARATSTLLRGRFGLSVPILGFSHSDKFERMKGVDKLVVLTSIMRDKSLKAGFHPTDASVFPNMLDYIPPLDVSRQSRQDFPIRLGFVGRLTSEKGLDLLLNALYVLRKRGVELHLHIAGSGSDEVEIKEQADVLGIRDALVFDGWVEDIASWMKKIDLAVFPSRYESFGIVVLEAAANGCPVISTKTDGPISQITHDKDGWLAEVGSVESLAETIEYAVGQRERWPYIVRSAHKRAALYSREALLPRLDELVNSTVRMGRRG